MTTPREEDHFNRIQLVAHLERERQLVTRYEENLLFYRNRIGERLYKLGKLDERLRKE